MVLYERFLSKRVSAAADRVERRIINAYRPFDGSWLLSYEISGDSVRTCREGSLVKWSSD